MWFDASINKNLLLPRKYAIAIDRKYNVESGVIMLGIFGLAIINNLQFSLLVN